MAALVFRLQAQDRSVPLVGGNGFQCTLDRHGGEVLTLGVGDEAVRPSNQDTLLDPQGAEAQHWGGGRQDEMIRESLSSPVLERYSLLLDLDSLHAGRHRLHRGGGGLVSILHRQVAEHGGLPLDPGDDHPRLAVPGQAQHLGVGVPDNCRHRLRGWIVLEPHIHDPTIRLYEFRVHLHPRGCHGVEPGEVLLHLPLPSLARHGHRRAPDHCESKRCGRYGQDLTTSHTHQTSLRCIENTCRTLLSQGTIRFMLPLRRIGGRLLCCCKYLRALFRWVSGIESTRFHVEEHAFSTGSTRVPCGREAKLLKQLIS